MARPVDMTKKIEELRNALQKYNGIPSQTVDRAAHANIKYYIKRYSDNPEIKALIEEYGLSYTKRDDFETQLEKNKAVLADLGKMPSSSQDKTLYQNVKYFFKRYKDEPVVEKLKYIYAFGCFPLPDTKYGTRPDSGYHFDPWDGVSMSDTFFEWKDNVSYEYIEYVFKHFKELPGRETKPMVRLIQKINHWYRYNVDTHKSEQSALYNFLQRMIEYGCEDELITQAYYSFKFNDTEVQEQVEKMLIENGACAIHYIAQTVMQEGTLSDTFVYFYYYIKLNDKRDDRDKMPLASLYSRVEPYRVLRIHFRDYHKCDVNRIRESAKAHYRDWRENRPETLEEWKYYGQSEFFDNKEDLFNAQIIGEYNSSIDWTTTYIEKQLKKGEPYFRYYMGTKRYLDYYLYLLENGYTLKDKDLQQDLRIEKLADDDNIIDEDWEIFLKMLRYLPNCFCDSDGGYYLQDENKCVFLCLTRTQKTYQLNKNTTKIARNAFRLAENDIEEIILNNKLTSKQANLDKCKNLKQIVVPPYCLDEYIKLFTKYEATKFHDLCGNKIEISPIINSNKLIYVPYTNNYIVPNNVDEIDKYAFRNSGIKHLTISGGIKEIRDSLFWYDNDLEEVTILEGVVKLWGSIFGNCLNLQKVTLPKSLTHLYNCFEGCSSLHTINLENVQYIGYRTFHGCTNLETICIEGHLRTLGHDAFDNCTNLKHIEFKNGIDEIEGAFCDCINLETITLRGHYKSFGYLSNNLGIYSCKKLKAIYVQTEFMDLFKEHFSSEYQYLLKEIY